MPHVAFYVQFFEHIFAKNMQALSHFKVWHKCVGFKRVCRDSDENDQSRVIRIVRRSEGGLLIHSLELWGYGMPSYKPVGAHLFIVGLTLNTCSLLSVT